MLGAVLDNGPVARSSVARLTGLSTASITGISAQLIERGLIREAPEAAGPPGIGRPHVPLDIDVGRTAVIGAHIAVPRLTVSLLDLRGRVLTQRQVEHDDPAASAVLPQLATLVNCLIRENADSREVLGLGVVTGGWVDASAGVVIEHQLLGWREVQLREALVHTNVPVHVDGHSRALVRAEQLFGRQAQRARSSMANLFVGNVVDVAFATGGTLHQGPRSAAGAIAHLPVSDSREPCLCGRTGCLQAAVSERTLLRRALSAGLIDRPAFRDLVALARTGDADALSLFHERARTVGRAAAMVLDLLNPEVLTVVEAGVNQIPGCLELLRDEIGTRSAVCNQPDQTVFATSFPGQVLSMAGGAAILDRVYAAPLTLGLELPTTSAM